MWFVWICATYTQSYVVCVCLLFRFRFVVDMRRWWWWTKQWKEIHEELFWRAVDMERWIVIIMMITEVYHSSRERMNLIERSTVTTTHMYLVIYCVSVVKICKVVASEYCTSFRLLLQCNRNHKFCVLYRGSVHQTEWLLCVSGLTIYGWCRCELVFVAVHSPFIIIRRRRRRRLFF